jgi:hypothetical protein
MCKKDTSCWMKDIGLRFRTCLGLLRFMKFSSASPTSPQSSSISELVKLMILFGCQTGFSFTKMKFWWELPRMPSK